MSNAKRVFATEIILPKRPIFSLEKLIGAAILTIGEHHSRRIDSTLC